MASEKQRKLDAFAKRQGYSSYYKYRNTQARAKGFDNYSELRNLRKAVSKLTPSRSTRVKDNLAKEIKRISRDLTNSGSSLADSMAQATTDLGAFVEFLKEGNTGLTQQELLERAAEILGLDVERDESEIWEWIRDHYPRQR